MWALQLSSPNNTDQETSQLFIVGIEQSLKLAYFQVEKKTFRHPQEHGMVGSFHVDYFGLKKIRTVILFLPKIGTKSVRGG